MPMNTQTPQLSLLMDLEARHEDLMLRLDVLDKRVQKTLSEWQGSREGAQENAPKATTD